MLLSLIKKITSNSSETPLKNPQQPKVPYDTAVVEVAVDSINLPSWKDKSIWTHSDLNPEKATSCREIQETITGNVNKNCNLFLIYKKQL